MAAPLSAARFSLMVLLAIVTTLLPRLATPPPDLPGVAVAGPAVLLTIALSVTSIVVTGAVAGPVSAKRPPPLLPAALPPIVALVTVRLPRLAMPPPEPPALFSSTRAEVTVRFPALRM